MLSIWIIYKDDTSKCICKLQNKQDRELFSLVCWRGGLDRLVVRGGDLWCRLSYLSGKIEKLNAKHRRVVDALSD